MPKIKSSNQNIILTILGSGTCVPSSKRFPSSYHIAISDKESWLIDIGCGALQRLSQAKIEFRNINRLFISHVHPDHIGSLSYFFQALNYTPGYKRKLPLTIYGNEEVENFIENIFKIIPALFPMFEYSFVKISDGLIFQTDTLKISTIEVIHSSYTHAFKFDLNGVKLIYGADTGLCDNIINISKDADYLILECSFLKERESSTHLNTYTAGQIAAASNPKQVLLTHFYPEVDTLTLDQFEGEIRMAGYAGQIIRTEDLMHLNIL